MSHFIAEMLQHPIILAFLVINLFIGFWVHYKSKIHSFEDYAIAGRGLPTSVLVMTYLATRMGGHYLGFPDAIYAQGLILIMQDVAVLLTCWVIGTFIAPRLIYFQGCLTLGDVMGEMYGRVGRIFAGSINLVFGFLIVGVQVQAMAALTETLLGIPPVYSVPLFGGIVVLYSVLGGMKAVSYTDVFQLFAALLAFIWVLRVLLGATGSISLLWTNLKTNHAEKMTFFSNPLFVHRIKSAIFWQFSLVWVMTPPIFQRMLVVGDKREVKKMWYIGGVVLLFINMLITIISMVAIAYKDDFALDDHPKRILLSFVNRLFGGQPWMIDLLFVGFVAFAISTMDSFLHATSLSFSQDVINPIRQLSGRGSLSAKQKTFMARLGVLLVGALAIVLGAMESTLENRFLNITIVYIYATIIIPLIIGVLGLKTDQKSWGSFMLSYLLSLGVLYKLGWSIYGRFLLSLCIAIVGYLLTHLYVGIFTSKKS